MVTKFMQLASGWYKSKKASRIGPDYLDMFCWDHSYFLDVLTTLSVSCSSLTQEATFASFNRVTQQFKTAMECVETFIWPVPLRHCSVVVNPLVRGSRWYFSFGRPLLSATCMLIWCFCSVNLVPSQYSRNCQTHTHQRIVTPGSVLNSNPITS